MIALDTNILVHAHRRGTIQHEQALSLLAALSEGPAPYALFWPSLYEFLRVVTTTVFSTLPRPQSRRWKRFETSSPLRSCRC